jgi:pyridoxamine 5'-phosphate oxidase
MTVSTIGLDGLPDARTTMLSDFDGEEILLPHRRDSRKAAELAAEPGVALTILWPGFTRQLVVQGTAQRSSRAESDAAYRRRSALPPAARVAEHGEFAQLPLAERRALGRVPAAHGGADDPAFTPPEAWAGFAVTPHRLVFWVSNPIAASRRIAYTREADRLDSHGAARLTPPRGGRAACHAASDRYGSQAGSERSVPRTVHCGRGRLRRPPQLPPHLLRGPIALHVVAAQARGHQVLPRVGTTARTRQDVVDRRGALPQ